MLTRISGGEIVDPANRRAGKGDLWIEDGRIVEIDLMADPEQIGQLDIELL
jgi:adenine deaminase